MSSTLVKCTAVFDYVQNEAADPTVDGNKKAAWTESVYFPGGAIGPAQDEHSVPPGDWCSRRARLLGNGIVLSEQRYQIVTLTPPLSLQFGAGIVAFRRFPSAQALLQDIPQNALLFRVSAVAPASNIATVTLRGTPDNRILGGGYAHNTTYDSYLADFFEEDANFRHLGRDLSQTKYTILSIDAAGNVVTQAPTPFVAQQVVQVLRTLPTGGRNRIGGSFTIATVTDSTHFQLSGWTRGAATGGRVRLAGLVFWQGQQAPNNLGTPAVGVRKVGRPFERYVGRRSRRPS